MKNSRRSIDAFIAQPAIALIGASRSGRGFGNVILRELRAKGMRVYPVHPAAATIDGVICYPSLDALPEPVGGLIVNFQTADAFYAVRDASAAGIKHVWIQQ